MRRFHRWQPGKVAPSWPTLRRLVYRRDRAVCWVCGCRVPWKSYNLGHLVDRCAGGADTPDNVVVMCGGCNYIFKPVHDTREQAVAWATRFRGGPYDEGLTRHPGCHCYAMPSELRYVDLVRQINALTAEELAQAELALVASAYADRRACVSA